MEREIKFRAWNGKQMEYSFRVLSTTGQPSTYSDMTGNVERDWEIMQFTGLLDKNGIEIYEGDVVNNGIHNYEVRFGRHGKYECGWLLRFKDKAHEIDYPICPETELEVIGNIYENSDLLITT